jgi:hypothetical protein
MSKNSQSAVTKSISLLRQLMIEDMYYDVAQYIA